MSYLMDDPVFQYRIDCLGGYGLTSNYLDALVDKYFPLDENYKFSDALRNDSFYDPEDLYESSWNSWN